MGGGIMGKRVAGLRFFPDMILPAMILSPGLDKGGRTWRRTSMS
jgi:hypothetical protein